AKLNLTLQVWDVKTGKGRRKVHVERDQGHTLTAAFSPGGEVLAVATSDGAVSFFDLAGGKRLRTFQGAPGTGPQLASPPDGKLVVLGSFDGQSLVWDVRTGKRLPQVDRPRYRFIGLAFSAGGRPLAGGQTRRGLLLRDVLTGKQLTPLVGHT